MPTLPAASAFTGSTVTEAQFKAAITDQREFLAGLLGTAGTQSAALTAGGALLNGVLNKSAAYLVVAADRGKLIDYTSAPYTVLLPTVANAGAGFVVGIKNSAASGVLTVGRNSANIDGAAANLTLNPGESCLILCDGTGWKVLGHNKIASGLAIKPTTYSTVGAWSHTVNPAAKSARITISGGGGGGGAGAADDIYTYVGGTGGSGGLCVKTVTVSAGTAFAGTVGGAGAGGALNSNGSAGSASTCTTYSMTAAGGGGGVKATAGANGAAGANGTASGGDTNTTGGGAGGGAGGFGYYAVGSAGSAGWVTIEEWT